ncbi:MAG: caspase family protein, partial [Arenimonas sp.]
QLHTSFEKLEVIKSERHQAKAALEVAQAQGDADEKGRLERVLEDKDNILVRQEQLVSNLKTEYETKVMGLTQKLEETEKRAKQIYNQLKNQQSLSDNTQLKLVDAEARLADTEKQLLESQQSYDKAVQEILSEKNRQSSEKPEPAQKQDLARIQQELVSSENERHKSESLIKQLQEEKKKYEHEIENLKKSASPVAEAKKPVIEIIDPPFVMERGTPTATVRAVDSRDIIGKVTSAVGILSVMVNDLKSPVDDRGIFNTPIEMKQEKTPVNVVAIDRNGGRETLNFLLFLKDVDRLTGDDGNARQADDSSSSQQRENWSNIEFGQYYALIIGNNEYRKLPRLDTPTNDARGVDEILRVKFGFKTQLLIDADRYQILSAMNEFRTKLTENDNLLIYYAGHGELDQVNMRGHWLPVDADADNNANWISTISITDILNTM